MNALLIFGLFVVAMAFGAEWSEWTETPDTTCSEDCGMCGTRVTAQRTCPTPGQCVGASEQTGACPPKMCLFPKRTCCKGYRKGLLDNKLQCIERPGWFTEASTTDRSTSTTESSTTTSS